MKVIELDDLEQASSSSVLPSGKAEMQQGTELPRAIQFEQEKKKKKQTKFCFLSYNSTPVSLPHFTIKD